MAPETIDHSTLHKLVESGVVDAAHVIGTGRLVVDREIRPH